MKSNETQMDIFDNSISIEKLEERLEMTSAADVTCVIVVL